MVEVSDSEVSGSPAYGESEQMLRVSLYCSPGGGETGGEESSVYSVSLENNNNLHLNNWTPATQLLSVVTENFLNIPISHI